MRRLDLVGEKFGRLEVIGFAGIARNQDGRAFTEWNVKCNCGCAFRVRGTSLKRRTKDLCNKCRRSETPPNFRHGLRRTPEYGIYYAAKHRCENPKNNKYDRYGGRGIKFLFGSFQEFIEELGPRPEGYVIDRADNEGNYERGNVRWVTRSQSILNSSKCLNKTKSV